MAVNVLILADVRYVFTYLNVMEFPRRNKTNLSLSGSLMRILCKRV